MTPDARQLARARAVDPENMAALTGRRRITADDVLTATNDADESDAGTGGRETDKAAAGCAGGDHGESSTDSGAIDDGASDDVVASPRARVVAEEYGVELSTVGNRLSKRRREADIQAYLRTRSHKAEPAAPRPASPRIGRRVWPISFRSRALGKMFERMSEVVQDNASTMTVVRVDVTDLIALSDRLVDGWPNLPSYTVLVIRATARTFCREDYRILNASVSGDSIETYYNFNVGVAVDSECGLLGAIVFDANGTSVRELSEEIDRLAAAVRGGSVDPKALEHGTFTVSNAGNLGAYLNTPVIDPLQTAVRDSVLYSTTLVSSTVWSSRAGSRTSR